MREPCLRVVLASHLAGLEGGAELSLLQLAVGLKEDGRVDPVVTVPSDGSFAAALRANSIRSCVLPTPWWAYAPYNHDLSGSSARLGAVIGGSRHMLLFAQHVRHWMRWLRAERPDVVLTSTATIPTPALASAVVGIPHVWWLQEFMTKDHGFRYLGGEPLSQRSIGWLSKVVVANSKAVWDHFSPPIRSDKMRLIYCGIDGFAATQNRVDIPTLRVLLLGKQTPSKGQEVALYAASILNSNKIQVHFRLVGPIDSAYRLVLQRLASKLGISDIVEIVDTSASPHEELAWAHVVLMCSRNEAFGRVTLEALKSGRPVIGARSGGTAELISDGVNGLLFEPGNPHDLATAVRHLGSQRDQLAVMSENAEVGTRDRFTIKSEVGAFVDVISTAAARQKDGRHVSRP